MTTITIPPEAVEAAARALYEAWCAFHGVTETSRPWEDIDDDDEERNACVAEARAAIRAALESWPGVTTTSWFENGVRKAVLNIPLPTNETSTKENNNG